ncbi:MAG: ribonuclease protein component [Acidobacteriales bacterium]|nr:ribonuclease protein component [Terriglobales bacterium]
MTAEPKSYSTHQPPPLAPSAAPASRSNAASPFGFPKSSRLLKHSTFQNVYEVGRRHFSTSMTFFFLLSDNSGASDSASRAHVGLTVGRALGGAVDRNRIKRRVRDVVRHQLGSLNAKLAERNLAAEIVINPKKAALTADVAVLRAEVERGFAVIAAAKPGVQAPQQPRRPRASESKPARRESKH